MPVASEELLATVISRKIESMMLHKSGTGMGSGGEEFGSLDFSRAHTEFFHSRLKSTEYRCTTRRCRRGSSQRA